MYKIYKHDKGFLAVEISNPNEILPDFNFTILEKELRECIESDFNSRIFFNSIIPNCETKFWKLSNNIETVLGRDLFKVVEMTQEEKDSVLLEEDKLSINSYFRDKKYKITVNVTTLLVTPYKDFITYCENMGSIIKSEPTAIGEGETQYSERTVWFDNIKSVHQSMIDNAVYSDGSRMFPLETNKYKNNNLEVIIE